MENPKLSENDHPMCCQSHLRSSKLNVPMDHISPLNFQRASCSSKTGLSHLTPPVHE